MLRRFRCSNGHEWLQNVQDGPLTGAESAPCPVCNLAGVVASLAAVGAAPSSQTALLTIRSVPLATIRDHPERPTTTLPSTQVSAEPPSSSSGSGERTSIASRNFPAVEGYELLSILGRGGMGIVYKARQLGLKRLVALKMTLAGPHTTAEELARFRAEAAAVARLQHPHIVQVYEIGEQAGCPYFVLEFVDGGSLHRYLGGIPRSIQPVAGLVETIARAMHYAHCQGIVHRDLKPSNILLARDDSRWSAERKDRPTQPTGDYLLNTVPKITDFGLAKRLDTAGGLSIQGGNTQSGTVLGTPSYMAPEQARGHISKVGPAADVYALGAILYEMLTGRPPFRAATTFDTVQQVLTTEPLPPSRLQPSIPRDLETICLKCLSKEPRKRYQSAEALAEDLRRFRAGEPIMARPTRSVERVARWCRRNRALSFLAGVVLALLVLGVIGLTVATVSIMDAYRESNAQKKLAQIARMNEERRFFEAQRNAEESERRLLYFLLVTGTRVLDQGDLSGSLHWFVGALRSRSRADDELETPVPIHPDPEQDRLRIRVAAILRECPRLARIWLHDAPTNYVAFSPDGQRVVTASRDHTARVWEARTGKPITAPLPHDDDVSYACFSPDGRSLVTTTSDGTAQVWQSDTGKRLVRFPRHRANVFSATFSPDGRRLATCSWDKTVQVLDLVAGKFLPPLLHEHPVWRAAFSPDGRVLATTNGPGVKFWNPATGHLLPMVLAPNADEIRDLAFSPDGMRLATASLDHSGRILDTATGRLLFAVHHEGAVQEVLFDSTGRFLLTVGDNSAQVWNALNGSAVTPPIKQSHAIWDAEFSRDGRLFVTASGDQARVWDTASGQPVTPPLKHASLVSHARFSPDARYLLTGGGETAQMWDLAVGQALALILPHRADVLDGAFNPKGDLLATASADGSVSFWDSRLGSPAAIGPIYLPAAANRIAFSPDGRYLLTVCQKYVQVWNVSTGQAMGTPLVHDGVVSGAVFSPDSRRVATASWDHTACIWEAASGRRVAGPLEHAHEVYDVAFSHQGRLVATGVGDRSAQVWDAVTGRKVGERLRHKAAVHSVLFSPADDRLLTGCADGIAQVWDLSTYQEALPPLKHNGPITSIAFSPDGRTVVTASSDRTARIWSMENGAPVTPPLQHDGAVIQASFSSDGSRLLTMTAVGTVVLWDVYVGRPLIPPLRHGGGAAGVAFSPDGKRMLSVGGPYARVWEPDLTPDPRPATDLQALAQVLDQHIADATDGFAPLDAITLFSAWEKLRQRYPASFGSSAAELLAWHRREALDCAQKHCWLAAMVHLDPLVASGKACWSEKLTRAGALGELRRWSEAAREYEKIVPLDASFGPYWSLRACAYLRSHNLPGYREMCARLRESFSQSKDPSLVARTAEVCRLEGELLRSQLLSSIFAMP